MSKLQEIAGACRVPSSPRAEHEGCRVLLLGEDNPQSSEPEHALYNWPEGCAGHRLQSKIFGLDGDEYLNLWRTNLCNPTWSTAAARERARLLLGLVAPPWDTIVMLGAKVAKIVGYPKMPAFSSCRIVPDLELGGLAAKYDRFGDAFAPSPGEFQLVYLPHPSGRCREWNEPANYGRARMLMRACVPEINWGAGIPSWGPAS